MIFGSSNKDTKTKENEEDIRVNNIIRNKKRAAS
jgi:hypothetical protein